MSDNWWIFQNSVEANIINSVSVFIALVHNLCLFLLICYRNKTHGVELSNIPSLMKPLYIITTFTYSGFLLYNISTVLISVKAIYEILTCTYSLYVVLITYNLSRYGVWLFSLTRIRVVFHVKILKLFGYSTKTLIIIFIILTYCFIQNSSITFITISASEVFITGNTSFCAYVMIYMPLVMFMQLTDQWCTIGCFILFWKKMRKINALEKSFGDGYESDDLKYVLRKYTILLATNILSSWLLTLFVTFTPLGIMAAQIDSMINMWTIVLFDAKYNQIYLAIFGCVAKQPKMRKNEITLAKHIEENTANTNTQVTQPITMIIHPATHVGSHGNKELHSSLVKQDSLKKPQTHKSIQFDKPSLKLDFAVSEPVPQHKVNHKIKSWSHDL